ncbi:MAG: group II intron reverse transcriptase/maturase [Bradymonadaceae bacterium]
MLQALEEGVEGGKWYSLIDKVWREATLRRAFERVKANEGAPGVDHQTVEDFERHLDANIERLSEQLREGSWQPNPVRRVWIPKPGRDEDRPLGIPTVEDRIVQMACLMVLEPIFESDFAPQSYGFRPGRSAKDALRRVDELLEGGNEWAVDADVRSYFDTIPHARLMERVEEKVSDGRMLELIESFLGQEVVDEDGEVTQPGKGTPQGGVISPLLANIYLDALDQKMAEEGYEMVRYADDFVVLCETEQQARQALELIEQWVGSHGLELHPEKTSVVEVDGERGIEFLGYHFHDGIREPRDKARQRFKEKIRDRTPRTPGKSLEEVIEDVNEISRGWYEYFQHSFWNVFPAIDGFVRDRLRAICRQFQDMSGPATKVDRKRWPNAYFADLGLFSMETARNRLL